MAYAVPKDEKYELSKVVLDKYAPATWSAMSPGKAVEMVDLSARTPEYETIIREIRAIMPSTTVTKVQRIQNPYILGAYLLKKAQNANLQEVKLFHATSQFNVASIASNNYDWRRTVRAQYGKGVYFSPSAAVADLHCNTNAGTKRAMIFNNVLVGSRVPGFESQDLPAAGYDTTTANNGGVFVKFSDNEFYPEYVAFYSKRYTFEHFTSLHPYSRSYRSSYFSYCDYTDYDDFYDRDHADYEYPYSDSD